MLNLYDFESSALVRGVNHYAHILGTGAFHAGVEVYGLEWSFSSFEGLYSCYPKQNQAHEYRESIPMGKTRLSPEQVERLIRKMSREWQGQAYHLTMMNCCHFSDDFCQRLGVGAVPSWLTPNLAAN